MIFFKINESFFIFLWKNTLSIFFIFILSSCGTLFGDEGIFPPRSYDYLNANEEENLKLPNNFSIKDINDLYPIPDLETNKLKSDRFVVPRVAAISPSSEKGSVLLQRLNKNQWILVNSPIGQVWPLIAGFLDSNKINYVWLEDSKGVIETEWLSHDNKKTEIVHHKYRIALSSGVQNATTEIRVKHVQAVKPNDNITWNMHSFDKEKEKDMLNLIAESIANNTAMFSYSLLARGVTSSSKVSLLFNDINEPYIFLKLPYERSWASLGLALQKTSFRVDDLDRSKGIYFVTLLDYKKEKKESFLSRIFKRKKVENELPKNNFEIFTDYVDGGLLIQVRPSSGSTLSYEDQLDLLRTIKNKLS